MSIARLSQKRWESYGSEVFSNRDHITPSVPVLTISPQADPPDRPDVEDLLLSPGGASVSAAISHPAPPTSSGPASILGAAESLSLDAVQPFASHWRVPVPHDVLEGDYTEAERRCILALIHVAFRYVSGQWITKDCDIDAATLVDHTGLSLPSVHRGCEALEASGLVYVDRSSSTYQYQLLLSPPRRRYVQVPSVLLRELASLPRRSAFAVLWVTIRMTLGFTTQEDVRRTAADGTTVETRETVHRRWAQLSMKNIARRSGVSVATARSAVKSLVSSGWVERSHPVSGQSAYYRMPTSVLHSLAHRSAVNAHLKGGGSFSSRWTRPPRTQSTATTALLNDAYCPSSFSFELPLLSISGGVDNRTWRGYLLKDCSPNTQSRKSRKDAPVRNPSVRSTAVCRDNRNDDSKSKRPQSPPRSAPSSSKQVSPDIQLSALPPAQREAYFHLVQAGVWRHRALRAVKHYSLARVRRNWTYTFSQKQDVGDVGAYLYRSIVDDYAFVDTDAQSSPVVASADDLKPRTWCTAEQMQSYIKQGISPDHFKQGPPHLEKPHFYNP